uniref:Uncharacterized protein n=1 Tax=Arundo donax TaxID=35708 RepID=A0A0A9CSI0_ARUDO
MLTAAADPLSAPSSSSSGLATVRSQAHLIAIAIKFEIPAIVVEVGACGHRRIHDVAKPPTAPLLYAPLPHHRHVSRTPHHLCRANATSLGPRAR